MRAIILLVLIPSCYAFLGIFGRQQSVGVIGTLKCNGKPAKGVKVKLYEKELSERCSFQAIPLAADRQLRFVISVFDRKMAEDKTDGNGWFKVSGTAKEVSKIDPQLNIYHKCNYKGVRCSPSPFE